MIIGKRWTDGVPWNLVAVLKHPLPDMYSPRAHCEIYRREEGTRAGDSLCSCGPCACEELIWVGGDGDHSGFRGKERHGIFCKLLWVMRTAMSCLSAQIVRTSQIRCTLSWPMQVLLVRMPLRHSKLFLTAESVASLRHQVLQVSLTYMCGVGQLSTGAYFLRRDFFPAIAAVRVCP